MNRLLAIVSFFLLCYLGTSGQYFYGGLGYAFPGTNFMVDSSGNVRFQPGDISFSMHAGAYAGTSFSGQSWFGTSISPTMAYNVSSRFRIRGGVSIIQGFGDNYYNSFDRYYYPMNTSGTTTRVFVQGDYILSNKILLSGAAYKYFTPYNSNIDDPRYYNPEGEGFMFNINYRPAKSFEINASFEYSRGNRYYSPNPFYRTSPFSADPFLRW
jgi:hypothetical protein